MIKTDILRLLPQREPMLMVDELCDADEHSAVTRLSVRPNNMFLCADGMLECVALIENIAQSASAFVGYKTLIAGGKTSPTGYIGEVRKFNCTQRPHVGDTLTTKIQMGAEAEGVSLLEGQVFVADKLVAETQMKIYVKA